MWDANVQASDSGDNLEGVYESSQKALTGAYGMIFMPAMRRQTVLCVQWKFRPIRMTEFGTSRGMNDVRAMLMDVRHLHTNRRVEGGCVAYRSSCVTVCCLRPP
nr:hypothetical protein CFP56_21338 [Quercus suber]